MRAHEPFVGATLYLDEKKTFSLATKFRGKIRPVHDVVGQVLSRAEEKGVAPAELSLEELRALSPAFEADVTSAFDFRASVERRDSEGGVSARAIKIQIRKAEEALRR